MPRTGKPKLNKTFYYEFIAEHSKYNMSYIQTALKNDPAIISFIDELIEHKFIDQEDKSDFYTNINIHNLSEKIKAWGAARRFQKSKNKGRPKGSKMTKVDIASHMDALNQTIEEMKSSFDKKMETLESLILDLMISKE